MSYAENDPFSQQSVFVNFNQDFTSLAVGTRTGYRFFALNNVDRLEQIHHSGEQEDIALIERLFNSSLVAFVSLPSSRKLKVCHFKRGKEITNFSYSNTILAVKLNRSRVVVCLEESLYIHNIQDMRVLHTIRDTPANPKGVCALSTASDRGVTYLAYPGSTSMGEIQIFDTENLCAKIMIPAHNSPLAALAFNANGSLLASASEKGTVIRVFSVTDGTRIYELRRGLKRCATIYSLAFNAESTLLACASNTETVHIFKLDENSASSGASAQPTVGSFQEEPGWMNMFGKALMSGSSYLPFAVSEVFAQGRSFATAKLTFSGIPSVVALSTIDRQCRLLVASTNGFLYVYNVNVEQGGECSFWRQHNLVEDVSGSGTTIGAPTTPGSGGGGDQIQEASKTSPHSPTSASSLRLQDDTEFPPMNHGVE